MPSQVTAISCHSSFAISIAGPINFCADPTPQCRDGNRTPILVEYVKGGKEYEMKQLTTVTFESDFGLKK